MELVEIPSGTQLGTWTVPDEWIVKEAWIKYNGEKILDYGEDPKCLMVYSEPVRRIYDTSKTDNADNPLGELKEHLYYSEENPDVAPYEYSFYEKKWGFCVKRDFIKTKKPGKCEVGDCHPELKEIDPEVGKVTIEGQDYTPEFEEVLKDGQYEVFIDSEFKPGTMKIGVHTIPGKTDREILLFAHLDHPYQANDNLSGVACLMDLAEKLKDKYEHTIKIVICPETIGSIAYAETQDISKVDFVISVDAVGNDNTLLIQKSFDKYARINYAVHLAVQELGISYRKGDFRLLIGSDETVFNDPLIGIPGILLSRFPYKEYHLYSDTPDLIKIDKIKEVQNVILKTIDIYEKDFIPARKEKGILMRSKYGLQTPHKLINRALDYLLFDIDGKKYLSEITMPLGVTFTYCLDVLKKLEENGITSRLNIGEGKLKKTSSKKQKTS